MRSSLNSRENMSHIAVAHDSSHYSLSMSCLKLQRDATAREATDHDKTMMLALQEENLGAPVGLS